VLTETPHIAGGAKPARREAFPYLFVVFAALLTLPILLPPYPPLVDYPSNLTRADILSRYWQVEHFRNIYVIQHVPLANLAIDLVVPPLAKIIGILAAGKLFLVLVFFVYAAGCYLLCGTAQGRPTWVAMLLCCFFYNTALTTGFMNYTAGIALYMLAFACWLRWSSGWNASRVTAFALLGIGCYFAHLSSIVILGISVFAVWCWESVSGRMGALALLWSAAAFVVPGILFIIVMRGPGRVGTVAWNSFIGKMQDLPLVIRTYSLPLDFIILAGTLLAVWLWVRASSGVTVHSPALVAGITLFLCFLLSPKDLFTSNAVDLRFVWPATVLATVAFRPRIQSRRAERCVACLLLLWIARTAVIGSVWEQLGNRQRQMIRVFDRLPFDASVYPVTFEAPDYDTAKRDNALRFTVNYAVVTRDAYVGGLTAVAYQQPLVRVGGPDFGTWNPGHPELWRSYDYVWTYKATPELISELRSEATLVASAFESALWRLDARRAQTRSN